MHESFRMAQFERKGIRYTRPRLLREINTHYRDQFLKQVGRPLPTS
jgi:hypothetical protein